MSKLAWIVVFATLAAAPAAAQQGAIPDLRGTWKGESESISGQATRIMLRPPRPSRGSTASRSR
jgi:hypothetical protein